MRHRKVGRQLRRTIEQKLALMRSLAKALIERGAIETTEAKAKELRPFVERLITKAKTWKPDLQVARVVVDGKITKVKVCTRCLHAGKVVRAPRGKSAA